MTDLDTTVDRYMKLSGAGVSRMQVLCEEALDHKVYREERG